MPRRADNYTIRGTVYRINHVEARVGLDIVTRLAALAPALLTALTSESAAALRGVLSPADVAFVAQAFAECTTLPPMTFQTANAGAVQGGDPVPLAAAFNDHFAGKYGELFEWLAACFKHNGFADFFVTAAGSVPPDVIKKAVAISMSLGSIGSIGA